MMYHQLISSDVPPSPWLIAIMVTASCYHCSCCCHCPFAAHCAAHGDVKATVLLLAVVEAIVICQLIVFACCYIFHVTVVAFLHTLLPQLLLSLPSFVAPCAAVLLIPLLLLLAIIIAITIATDCQLIAASF